MRLNDFCKCTQRTRGVLENKKMDNIHMIMGIITEAGELADTFKKNIAYGKEIDWVNIAEELGDIMFYLGGFCDINELDFEKILDANVEKLRIRYPEKFTQENAQVRNLDAERSSLEQSIGKEKNGL